MKKDVGSEATYRNNWVIVSSDLNRELFLYQRPLLQCTAYSKTIEMFKKWAEISELV